MDEWPQCRSWWHQIGEEVPSRLQQQIRECMACKWTVLLPFVVEKFCGFHDQYENPKKWEYWDFLRRKSTEERHRMGCGNYHQRVSLNNWGSREHEQQFRRKAQGSIPQPEVPGGSSECAHECGPQVQHCSVGGKLHPIAKAVFSTVNTETCRKVYAGTLHSCGETQEGYLSSDPSKWRAASESWSYCPGAGKPRKKCLTPARECHTWGWSCPESTEEQVWESRQTWPHGAQHANLDTNQACGQEWGRCKSAALTDQKKKTEWEMGNFCLPK